MPQLLRNRETEWYLNPPPAPPYDTLDMAHARASLAELQQFVDAAVLHIRYVVAKLRARGSAPNVEQLVDRYASASRQAFESRATLKRGVETLRQTVRDLRKQASETTERYPDIAAPLFAKADEIEQRIGLFIEHVNCHQRLVEVYSEALQGLAAVRNEPPELSRIAALVGPTLGATTLGALMLPNLTGVMLGFLVGLASAILWRRLLQQGATL